MSAIESTPLPIYATGFLEIDTKAIAHNYRTLQSMLPQTICAAVLKADAYGFGAKVVAPVLMNQGCQSFFVAHLEEGLFLRSLLKEPLIYVLQDFFQKQRIFLLRLPSSLFLMILRWLRIGQRKPKVGEKNSLASFILIRECIAVDSIKKMLRSSLSLWTL